VRDASYEQQVTEDFLDLEARLRSGRTFQPGNEKGCVRMAESVASLMASLRQSGGYEKALDISPSRRIARSCLTSGPHSELPDYAKPLPLKIQSKYIALARRLVRNQIGSKKLVRCLSEMDE